MLLFGESGEALPAIDDGEEVVAVGGGALSSSPRGACCLGASSPPGRPAGGWGSAEKSRPTWSG